MFGARRKLWHVSKFHFSWMALGGQVRRMHSAVKAVSTAEYVTSCAVLRDSRVVYLFVAFVPHSTKRLEFEKCSNARVARLRLEEEAVSLNQQQRQRQRQKQTEEIISFKLMIRSDSCSFASNSIITATTGTSLSVQVKLPVASLQFSYYS